MNAYRNIYPRPSGREAKKAGHHWLEKLDYDGQSFGLVVLQWNPYSERWYHSDQGGSIFNWVDATGWRYIEDIPLPGVGEPS